MKEKIRNNLKEIIYIILLTIAFCPRYGDIHVNPKVQYIIAAIIISISFFCFIKDSERNKKAKEIKYFFNLYFIPALLIHLYTLLFMIFGIFDSKYLSSNVSMYLPILVALSSIYMFREKAFKYNLIALIISWGLSVFSSLLLKGVNIIPYAIMQGYFGNSNPIGQVKNNYLELHDLVLSVGYILVYCWYVKNENKKITKKQIFIISTLLIIFALGIKRIAVLGVVIAIIFIQFIKFIRKEEKRVKICKIVGTGILIFSYLFIWLLFNNEILYDFCDKLNINLMGRNYYYKVIVKYGEFSPSFLGIGRNSVTKILTQEHSYLRVGGVHSDILKSYMENGFILFGLWAWYYLVKITENYAKKFNKSSAILYFSLTIYTFILYFTDNVENYFIYQIFNIVIPITYTIKQEYIKKEISK